MSAGRQKAASSLFWISDGVWGSWWGRTRHYPGEEEAQINLHNTLKGETVPATETRSFYGFPENRLVSVKTLGWCAWSAVRCGATVSLFFYWRPTSREGVSCLAAQICPWGSFFHLERISFSLLWLHIKTSLSVIFPSLSARKQHNYTPLVSEDGDICSLNWKCRPCTSNNYLH